MQTALLFLILAILLLAGVLLLVILRKKPLRVYKPKGQFLLSKGEAAFFNALYTAIEQPASLNLYICSKCRIADIVEVDLVPTDPNYWKTLAPINQKHVDFVLVNRSDFAPRAAIELDGGSHKDQARE